MPGGLRWVIALATAGACGGSESGPEIVVPDASLGGAPPVLLGATATTVFWSAASGATSTLIGGASVASLPATGMQLASATGAIAQAGDHVLFVDGSRILRVDGTGSVEGVDSGTPEALGGDASITAWGMGADVAWKGSANGSATLIRIDRLDHLRVANRQIHIAADGAGGRRLVRVDAGSGTPTSVTTSASWAPMFPGGGIAGSTYQGRIVDADDEAALWLVEEMPSERGILVREPVQGEASVLLEHVKHASGFFASADALYWQEGDALLTASRAGGPADIAATLTGTAGAFADGYIYIADGAAISRLRVE